MRPHLEAKVGRKKSSFEDDEQAKRTANRVSKEPAGLSVELCPGVEESRPDGPTVQTSQARAWSR